MEQFHKYRRGGCDDMLLKSLLYFDRFPKLFQISFLYSRTKGMFFHSLSFPEESKRKLSNKFQWRLRFIQKGFSIFLQSFWWSKNALNFPIIKLWFIFFTFLPYRSTVDLAITIRFFRKKTENFLINKSMNIQFRPQKYEVANNQDRAVYEIA